MPTAPHSGSGQTPGYLSNLSLQCLSSPAEIQHCVPMHTSETVANHRNDTLSNRDNKLLNLINFFPTWCGSSYDRCELFWFVSYLFLPLKTWRASVRIFLLLLLLDSHESLTAVDAVWQWQIAQNAIKYLSLCFRLCVCGQKKRNIYLMRSINENRRQTHLITRVLL